MMRARRTRQRTTNMAAATTTRASTTRMAAYVMQMMMFTMLFDLAELATTASAWETRRTATRRTRVGVRSDNNLRAETRAQPTTVVLSATNSRIPDDYEAPYYPLPRKIDEALLGDLTGGRPGAIIETEEQLAAKDLILQEIQDGTRQYPALIQDYGQLIEDEEAEYDIDDPDAIDAATLGTWTIQDLRSKFPYEWEPQSGAPDPNLAQLLQEDIRFLPETEKNEDGVEVGYDPVFGPSNPMDTRTILGALDSYMINEKTRDDRMLAPQFPEPADPEITYNEEIVAFRKSLDILETYIDPFLPADLPIPRHVAVWYGYPEQVFLEPQNFTHNRFTALEEMTDFDSLTPHEARRKAVELARSKNAEWLPDGVSQAWHQSQRAPYEAYGTLVGTLQPGRCDPELVEAIQPALAVLGSCAVLLSVEGIGQTVYRFAYHGLMKNKHGMQCWTETLLQDCGVTVTGVIFETGFRRRDPAYDGGDPWYGPSF